MAKHNFAHLWQAMEYVIDRAGYPLRAPQIRDEIVSESLWIGPRTKAGPSLQQIHRRVKEKSDHFHKTQDGHIGLVRTPAPASRPEYGYDEIESLIRTKLQRARQTNDSWIEKRANRNVQKFILDLAHDESVGEAEALSIGDHLSVDERARGGTVFGLVHSEVSGAISGKTEKIQSECEQFIIDFTLNLVGRVWDPEKVDRLAEKLRLEKYPA